MARISRRSDQLVIGEVVRQCGASCPRRAAETQRPATAEQKQAAELVALMRDLLAAKRRGGLVVTEAADTWQVLEAPKLSALPARRASVPAANTAAGEWVTLVAPEV
jgi:hypothetical protein